MPGGPRRADEMVDMLGVVVHLTGDPSQTAADHRSDYLYSVYRDDGPGGAKGWLALVAAAGFRHARCDTGGSIAPGTEAYQQFALETMRLLDTTKPAWSPSYVTGIDKVFLSGAGVAEDLPVLRRAAGRIWMIEGPNEAWPPNGKFIPSYVENGGQVYMCLHAMDRAEATMPDRDGLRWQPCRQRGAWDPSAGYEPGDVVTSGEHVWAAPPSFTGSARGSFTSRWWDLTAQSMPSPFSTDGAPGIYAGYDQAGELGVAWGELIRASLDADDAATAGYWTRAGRYGGPTRIATWSEAGMDIYFWWNPQNDASLLGRYLASMPGGATNVHLYASAPTADVAAACGAALEQAQVVLPGYAVYLGELGQATYPTDDFLALGTEGGAVPTSTTSASSGSVPTDQHGRPMPGSTTARFGAEVTQAQVITRTWAEMFRTAPPGSRVAVYELLNEPFNGFGDYAGRWGYPASGGPFIDYNRSEGNFGLLRGDFSPKPAYAAISNTARLMGDTGDQRFVPEGLGFVVTRGGPLQASAQPDLGPYDEIYSVLTQGSDGVFRIPTWYVNVRSTQGWLDVPGLSAPVSAQRQEPVTLTVTNRAVVRLEAFNVSLSGVTPIAVVTHGNAITWTHTVDLWIIKVHPE
jgi:hypothetical protein